MYGYVPTNDVDPDHVGRRTREGSRTLEYAFEDFAIRYMNHQNGLTWPLTFCSQSGRTPVEQDK